MIEIRAVPESGASGIAVSREIGRGGRAEWPCLVKWPCLVEKLCTGI